MTKRDLLRSERANGAGQGHESQDPSLEARRRKLWRKFMKYVKDEKWQLDVMEKFPDLLFELDFIAELSRKDQKNAKKFLEQAYELVSKTLNDRPRFEDEEPFEEEFIEINNLFLMSFVGYAVSMGCDFVARQLYQAFKGDIRKRGIGKVEEVLLSEDDYPLQRWVNFVLICFGMYDLVQLSQSLAELASGGKLLSPFGDEKDNIASSIVNPRALYMRAILDTPILIAGETGTSKGLLARALHELSDRRDKPYIEINCAAIPKDILESELFGYVKGAFTGAHRDKKGRIAEGDEGTVFFDELGKMDPYLQVKILKVVEEKRILPIGGTEDKGRAIDVKFIAATQFNSLSNIIDDLKYRLGYPDLLRTLTLKERFKIDGPMVVQWVFTRVEHQIKRSLIRSHKGLIVPDLSLSSEAESILLERTTYPGNYRELENLLRGAINSALCSRRSVVEPDDLSTAFSGMGGFDTDAEEKGSSTAMINNLRLVDLLPHNAKEIMRRLTIEKCAEVQRTGQTIKGQLKEELGAKYRENDYRNFIKRMRSLGISLRGR